MITKLDDGRLIIERPLRSGWQGRAFMTLTLDEARQLRDELTRVLGEERPVRPSGGSHSWKHPMRKPGGPQP